MKAAVASMVSAAIASACCIGPVVLVLLGAGTFGALLGSLEPYRPIFIGITTVFLGFSFYGAYRPMKDCETCSPASRRRRKRAVWVAALVVAVLIAFPYYVGFLF